MLRRILFLCLLCLVLSYSQLTAQKPIISFQHLNLAEGNSESTTRFILEDTRGYLWIGTDDGANKYNGYSFETYKNNYHDQYSISSNDCKESFLDSKGRLWVVTRNGLNLYDQILNRFYNFQSKRFACFKTLDGDIEEITEDENGSIWITEGSEGLHQIDSLNLSAKNFKTSLAGNASKLYGIASDKNGSLWIGTRDGLLKFDITTKKFIDVRSEYGTGYEVKRIFFDGVYNRLWLCTNQGIKLIDFTNNQFKEFKHNASNPTSISGNNIIKIIHYKDETYLIAVDGGGVDFLDYKKQLFYHYTAENEGQVSANNVTYVYKDSKNTIWAGSFMSGVDYSNALTNKFTFIKNNPYSEISLKKGIVTNFLKDAKGNLWVATDGGGLYQRKAGTENFTSFNPFPSIFNFEKFPIIYLVQDLDGLIWMATYGGGLVCFDPNRNSLIVKKNQPNSTNCINSNYIRSLTVDKQNRLWILCYFSGITIYDKKKNSYTHYKNNPKDKQSILSDWCQHVYEDTDGKIWIATFKGLNKYNPKEDNFTPYQFSSSKYSFISCNHLLDIEEASDGNLYLSTIDAGIIRFNRNSGNFELFSTEQGLYSNVVKAVIEDDNKNIWFSTNNGVGQLNLNSKKITSYSSQDGIPPYLYYYNSKYKDNQGRIYFGNSKGFLIINPSSNLVDVKYPLVITDIKIVGKPLNDLISEKDSNIHVSYLKEIHLNYSQNDIELDFASLNFINSNKSEYAYLLEGYEKEWRYVGTKRYAKYTNLDPGVYTFKVKCATQDGNWDVSFTSLTIIISPPWWKTWWFIVLESIFILLFLYLIYSLRVHSIRKKNNKLEETVLKRTEELRLSNEQLEAFIYKASHDIKGPLKSIIGLTTVGQKDVTDPTSLVYFDHILKSTKKLDNLLADLLELTKVKETKVNKEKINFRELIDEAISKFEHMEGYKDVHFTVMVKENEPFYSDRKLLYSIIQNLIENPIKYRDTTRDNCYLDIEVTVGSTQTTLKFSDNGIGIPFEIQQRVFEMFFKASERSQDTGLGLHIVKTSVEKLEGTIRLDSKLGSGSIFTVTLPN